MRRDYRGREVECYREIVDLDKIDVQRADSILVCASQPSVGTSMEVFYAWTLGRPIVVWVPDVAKVSPWFRYHSTSIASDFKRAVNLAAVYARV